MKLATKLQALALVLAFPLAPCLGAEFEFEASDVVLGVHAYSGNGTTQNIFFRLGNSVDIKNNPDKGVVGNIFQDLNNTFDSNWFERSEVHFGAFGNRSAISGAGVPPEEPGRTIYVSRATAVPGAAPLHDSSTNPNTLGNAASKYAGLRSVLAGTNSTIVDPPLMATASGATIMDQTQQPVMWQNSWTVWNPQGQLSFNLFRDIQNHFGQEGAEVFLDLQRIVPNSTPTYVATIGISSTGDIRVFKAGGNNGGDSAFDEWIAQYESQIPNEADRTAGADPDGDGDNNLKEFAFGGSPASSSDSPRQLVLARPSTPEAQGDLTLTLEVRSGASFAADGPARSALKDGVRYRIEGSLDLSAFDQVVEEVIPHLGQGTPRAGYEFKTFRLNASSGLGGKGFLRASATEEAQD